jgi:predicted SAM-dependent methyltransferase
MNRCNLCEFKGFFLDHANRKYVRCPICKSFERQRFIWDYISSNIHNFYNKTILHIAPEINLQKKLKSFASKYIGIDMSPNRFGPDIIQMDLTNLLIENNSLDVVICSHVLEHILDDNKAIIEIHRVLKIGGFCLICVPMYSHSHTITHSVPDHLNHVRNYGFKDLNNQLCQYFDTKMISSSDLDIDLQEKYALKKNQKLFIGYKNYEKN